MRCTLRDREPTGKPEAEAADAATGTEREGPAAPGELLPVQSYLREGHQRLYDCGLDTKESQWDRTVRGGDRLLQQQDGLRQGRYRQVEPLHRDCRRPQQVSQGLGPSQGRAPKQSSVEAVGRDSGGTEELKTGTPAVLMPLQGPGGMVGAVLGELRVTMTSGAEAWDRCTMEERQHLWNDTDDW